MKIRATIVALLCLAGSLLVACDSAPATVQVVNPAQATPGANVAPAAQDPAVQQLQTAVAANPQDSDGFYRLGNALAGQDQTLADAVKAYKQAIVLKPDFTDAQVNLGVADYRLGQFDEAAAAYGQALKSAPDDAGAHYLLGAVYIQQARLDDAEKEFNAAVKLQPDLPQVHYGLGALYKEQGKKDQAIAEFNRFLELDNAKPSGDPEARSQAQQQLQELQGK